MKLTLGAFDALAERYGVAAEFVDAHGAVQQTAPATKRALLAALGVVTPDADDAAARDALAACERESWERPLPAVVVARPDNIVVPIVFPSTGDVRTWRIVLEDGSEIRGSIALDDLPLVARNAEFSPALERREWRLERTLPEGYHRLSVDGAFDDMAVIVTPAQCWLPPAVVAGERLGGMSLALYLLRSEANWGIGDFSDLRRFVELVAERGADVVGLNPLHALFVDEPERASPYSPASRLLLNVLNIDVTAIPEFAAAEHVRAHVAGPEFAARLERCRDADYVRYSEVAVLKMEVLRLVFAAFSGTAGQQRRDEFAAFRSAADPSVERTYLFLALREYFAQRDSTDGAWQTWPPEFQDPDAPAVADFAATHARSVTFVAWLQWVAEAQLRAVAEAAGGMRVGLYRDLAVGADPGGAEIWSNPRVVADAARVGAPPDIYNPQGQNWDLPPFRPHVLRAEGYASFIRLVRANMRHAGALRIDHVMALERLYWIPRDASPADGGFVHYPLEDLLGILALESRRARCLIVGEDLGTVPAGFRERMAAANVLSYRVLFFEREPADGAFLGPERYPRLALAVLGSHDLPTLRAWWSGADIDLRERLGLATGGGATAAEQRRVRAADRAALVAALRAAGSLDARREPDALTVYGATHAFLARSNAALAVAQIDDVTAEIEPVNVPTTSDENPNWRRRLSSTLEELGTDVRFAKLLSVFRTAGRLRA